MKQSFHFKAEDKPLAKFLKFKDLQSLCPHFTDDRRQRSEAKVEKYVKNYYPTLAFCSSIRTELTRARPGV